jgi:hypothetical protein
MNMNELLTGIVRAKACSVKAEKGGTSKTINLSIDYSECTLADILTKAVAHDVIAWQNGQGRKNFATLVDKQSVSIKASRPGAAPQIDPETAMAAKLQSMTQAEREKYLMEKFGLKILPTAPQTEPLK